MLKNIFKSNDILLFVHIHHKKQQLGIKMKYAMYLACDDFLDCFGGIFFSLPEERAGYQAK